MRPTTMPLMLLMCMTLAAATSHATSDDGDDGDVTEVVTIPAEVSSLGRDAENNWLRQRVVELQKRANDRRGVATPGSVRMTARFVEMAWKDTHGQAQSWRIPVELYRSALRREKPDTRVFLGNGAEKRYRAVDFRPFVDTEPFRELSMTMRDRAGSDEEFLAEVLAMVSQLTVYAKDNEDQPNWPLETLVENGGDCEDTSILIASLLQASGRPFKVEFVYFDVKNPKVAARVNHVALRVTTPAGDSRVIESTAKQGDRNYAAMPDVAGWYVAL